MLEHKKEIRFALTNRCNFDCVFCHNEGMCKKETYPQNPTPKDYGFITDVASRCFDIKKFVLTGGEPLILKDIIDIAKEIKKNGGEHITLITNGSLLSKKKNILKEIDEIHISLGTLDKEKYQNRTNSGIDPKQVKKTIEEISKDFKNIKLNVIMLDSENKDCGNILELIDFAKKLNIELYLIEYFPEDNTFYFSFRKIEKLISSLGYIRSREEENKVLFVKKKSPNIKIVFVPCAFVDSPLVSDPENYCKANQSIYILPNFSIQPCFLNQNSKISIYDSIKEKDEGEFIRLIKIARAQTGCNCPLTF